MLSFRWLPFALMLQLVVAHLHCLCHHEIPALQPHRTFHAAKSQSVPERHCHNEFGCICKGALVVQSVDCPAPELAFSQMLPTELLQLEALAANSPAIADLTTDCMPSGRMLRAQLSSFLI